MTSSARCLLGARALSCVSASKDHRQQPVGGDIQCPLARFGQGDIGGGSHADMARPALPDISKNPGARSPFADLQIGAMTDSIAPPLGQPRELLDAWKFSHGPVVCCLLSCLHFDPATPGTSWEAPGSHTGEK